MSQFDQYKTVCPACGCDDLRVTQVKLAATGETLTMNTPLQSDGFEFDPNDPDIKDCSTEDEKVKCTGCQKEFDLCDLML